MELTLFLIVGAIALLSAVMMLISENAVYSALFLILNFASIAFLYLMLDAGFLAMVQLAVYAGAIMVLFLFVIMLLGADPMRHAAPRKLRWLPKAAVVLAVIFLLTASVALIRGDVGQVGGVYPTLTAEGQALTFGSPTHIGWLLFTRYVLPLEVVALLLLVAMVGAIVLTRDSVRKRPPVVRRLANPPAELERPIIGESGQS